MDRYPSRNVGLDLIRVTEATALAAARWLGSGDREGLHQAATETMARALNLIEIDGCIVIGEEGRLGEASPLDTGQQIGTGDGPSVDVVVDPVDGTELVAKGHLRAISVVSVAPRGSMWSPQPAIYMDKIVVDRDAAEALVPECLDAPVGWTLAAIARAKDKEIRDLQVIVLDRPRHQELIDELRLTGARVLLRDHGDTSGALVAATPGTGADALMGIGGVPEGVTAACAVRALGGAMLGRLAPQSEEEHEAIKAAGLDVRQILTCNELVTSQKVFFAATGVTSGVLLSGVEFWGRAAKTQSLVIRGETGTRRTIDTEYGQLDDVFGAKGTTAT